MTPEKLANVAWATLIAGVAIYDWRCPEGATLSEACDRAIEKHPLLTVAAIGSVALHLLNVLPPQVDPIHQLIERLKL